MSSAISRTCPTCQQNVGENKRGAGAQGGNVPRVQRVACAGAGPCSSDTSGSREGRRCPVCTAVFSRAHCDLLRSFGLLHKKEQGRQQRSRVTTTRQPAPVARPSLRSLRWKETPHTLLRWPCARGTTATAIIIVVVVVVVIANVPSLRRLEASGGFTRRLRLSDLDALRHRRRCRVLGFDGGWLFSFLLFSLNCLSHMNRTNILEGEWLKRKERTRRERSVGMFSSQHDRDLEPTRPLVARLCNTVKDMIYCLVLSCTAASQPQQLNVEPFTQLPQCQTPVTQKLFMAFTGTQIYGSNGTASCWGVRVHQEVLILLRSQESSLAKQGGWLCYRGHPSSRRYRSPGPSPT